MQLRHVGRQVGVPLVGADDEGAGLADREIATGHPGVGIEDQRVGRLPLRFRQVVDVAVARVGAERRANTSATSVRSLWTAGTTTWLGSSLSSCWMRSPRSVSITSMPTEAM